jgi:hypothetical protein
MLLTMNPSDLLPTFYHSLMLAAYSEKSYSIFSNRIPTPPPPSVVDHLATKLLSSGSAYFW